MTRPIKHHGPTTSLNFVLTESLKDEVMSSADMLTELAGKSISAGDLARAGLQYVLEAQTSVLLERIGR